MSLHPFKLRKKKFSLTTWFLPSICFFVKEKNLFQTHPWTPLMIYSYHEKENLTFSYEDCRRKIRIIATIKVIWLCVYWLLSTTGSLTCLKNLWIKTGGKFLLSHQLLTNTLNRPQNAISTKRKENHQTVISSVIFNNNKKKQQNFDKFFCNIFHLLIFIFFCELKNNFQ